MGSSAKKKREKKQDFQKTKLKVGKSRPKNTNATDTSFSAKSIVFKQQNLNEAARDENALFNNNLSLLSSRTETQRKDALTYLISTTSNADFILPQPTSVILSKVQPLVLDGNSSIRQQVLKLLRGLPQDQVGSVDQLLLYVRAGLTHLSNDIRLSSLDVFDWLVTMHGDAVLASAGGWVKTLLTFQNILVWTNSAGVGNAPDSNGKWSMTKPSTSLGNGKLRVHQISSLAAFLALGLRRAPLDELVRAREIAGLFPMWRVDAHMLSRKSNAFGNLNLFGTQRDAESEIYDDVEERRSVFVESGLGDAFSLGVREAKREGGEVGRAAAAVEKALNLVNAT